MQQPIVSNDKTRSPLTNVRSNVQSRQTAKLANATMASSSRSIAPAPHWEILLLLFAFQEAKGSVGSGVIYVIPCKQCCAVGQQKHLTASRRLAILRNILRRRTLRRIQFAGVGKFTLHCFAEIWTYVGTTDSSTCISV